MISKRNRTSSEYIGYGLYLYFLGLSLRNVVKALSYLLTVKRSHVSIWKWIQKFHYQRKSSTKKKQVSEYIVDETMLKVGSEFIWLWIAIEPENRQILAQNITKERNMLVAERFMSDLVKIHGKRPVSTDGGTWYPMACQFLKLKHHIHSSYEKSLIERKMQYIKDRTECFDDYFPCRKKNCKLKHVRNWLNLFVNRHNEEMIYA
ncbi:MAG: DDE-type integrase/transposase/recombinase [Candidatus Nitrosocosmicus sp.]|nr:DDE-type integrase/transposase/recombinase [Candidatus Nitrosocosmicus sp.]